MGLSVMLSPTLIRLHWLTDEQLENLAGMNGVTAIALAFLGMCVGASVSYHAALVTGNFKDEIGRTRFELYEQTALLLCVFFGLLFVGALALSVRRFFSVRSTTTQQQTQDNSQSTAQSTESYTHEN